MNGQIYGHLYGCDWEGTDFVFLNCGETNLDSDYEYWGGVRFSVKEFEQELFHSRIHDAVTHGSHQKHESILEYVQVFIHYNSYTLRFFYLTTFAFLIKTNNAIISK